MTNIVYIHVRTNRDTAAAAAAVEGSNAVSSSSSAAATNENVERSEAVTAPETICGFMAKTGFSSMIKTNCFACSVSEDEKEVLIEKINLVAASTGVSDVQNDEDNQMKDKKQKIVLELGLGDTTTKPNWSEVSDVQNGEKQKKKKEEKLKGVFEETSYKSNWRKRDLVNSSFISNNVHNCGNQKKEVKQKSVFDLGETSTKANEKIIQKRDDKQKKTPWDLGEILDAPAAVSNVQKGENLKKYDKKKMNTKKKWIVLDLGDNSTNPHWWHNSLDPPFSVSNVQKGGNQKKKEKLKDFSLESSNRANRMMMFNSAVSSSVSDVQNGENQKKEEEEKKKVVLELGETSTKPNPRLCNPPNHLHGEQVAAGWPSCISSVAAEAINGWTPRRATSFQLLDKIGQGTRSNVYKARDKLTGKTVALKKIRFNSWETESVKFMAKEILMLRRLDHPNVIKLEGAATSRMPDCLYLVFQYMEHDLAGLAASPGMKNTEAQVKSYVRQLLLGLEHCHNHGVLHCDINLTNLLVDNGGILKIAGFGSASFSSSTSKQPLTGEVGTLWYRSPELLLGATNYGVGVDLWSTGCVLSELLALKPIMPGLTRVDQLHKIYKLCGSSSEEFWQKSTLPHASALKPVFPYHQSLTEVFKDFPPSPLPLIETLLAIDPVERQTAAAALRSEFFTAQPYDSGSSSLAKYPPLLKMDSKLQDGSRLRPSSVNSNGDGVNKIRRPDTGVSLRLSPADHKANTWLEKIMDGDARIYRELNIRMSFLSNRGSRSCTRDWSMIDGS